MCTVFRTILYLTMYIIFFQIYITCSIFLIIVQYKLSFQYYLQEQIWSSLNYQPSFKEHEEVSIVSSGLPMLTIITLMGYGDEATHEVFEWVSGIPEMVRAGSQVTRFLNDLSSYKVHLLYMCIKIN